MKASLPKLRKHRFFSEGFKRELVREFDLGKYNVGEISRLHQIAPQVVYRWIYKYSTFHQSGARIVEMKQSSTQKVKELEKRIKELEQAVGRKQIMIDYLETMMEVAKEELNIDIKKNYGTPPSGSSGKGKGQ